MEALCELLFELSNDDRLMILAEINNGPIKLSNIAKNLGFAPQATTSARPILRLVFSIFLTSQLVGRHRLHVF